MIYPIPGPWSRHRSIVLVLHILTSVVPSVGPHEKLTLIRVISHTTEITDYGQVSRTSRFSYLSRCSRNAVRNSASQLEAGSVVSGCPTYYEDKINLLNAPLSVADGNK